jgi:hypothetical protein
MATQDEWTRVTIRIPPTLHERLQDAAATDNRSMNAEIIARLTATFSLEVNRMMNAMLNSDGDLETDRLRHTAAAAKLIQDAAEKMHAATRRLERDREEFRLMMEEVKQERVELRETMAEYQKAIYDLRAR